MGVLTTMWYQGRWFQWLLLPLTALFYLLSTLRRLAFRWGVIPAVKLPVPIVVVGNISVGGNGKTPLVVALCDYFSARGLKVGVVSRGYGAKRSSFPHCVRPTDPIHEVGDEPMLLARRTGLPVVIDPNRPRAAQLLIDSYQCDLIISDDGLQHYAMQRDCEIVVTDRRLFGNGYLLPMGPLREGIWRLRKVDAIVINEGQQHRELPISLRALSPFAMQFKTADLVNIKDSQRRLPLAALAQQARITALAGIGDPQRFFSQLEGAGVTLSNCIALPDHHQLSAQDLPTGCVIMTEKDAVKAVDFAHDNCWYQPIDAVLPDSFYNHIVSRLSLSSTNKDL